MMGAEEFLEWERQQREKHQWVRGEVFAMAGGSPRHGALAARAIVLLSRACADRCTVLSGDVKVMHGEHEAYVYPDASVACGGRFVGAQRDVLANPAILVEVLSPTTEAYDRGDKWLGYQANPELQDYLLVSQAHRRVEHFQRDEAGGWHYREYGPGQTVVLRAGGTLLVDELFTDDLMALPGSESDSR